MDVFVIRAFTPLAVNVVLAMRVAGIRQSRAMPYATVG
jgi:hypothetical protein